MSVGGKVVQVYEHVFQGHPVEDVTWVNTLEESSGECCAIFISGHELPIKIGDTLWWQQGKAWWTSQKGEKQGFTKVGCSGVNHPLGKEYQIKFDHEHLYKKRKEDFHGLLGVLRDWLKATPTKADGTYDEINHPNAHKANSYVEYLKTRWKDV